MYFCEETGEFIHPIFFDSHEEAREVRANSTDAEVCENQQQLPVRPVLSAASLITDKPGRCVLRASRCRPGTADATFEGTQDGPGWCFFFSDFFFQRYCFTWGFVARSIRYMCII